jgi:hypothetical protein
MKVTLTDGTEYTFSTPKGKHLRLLADVVSRTDNEMLSAYKMVSILIDPPLSVEDIDELEGEDVLRLLEVVKGFRLNSPTKGV